MKDSTTSAVERVIEEFDKEFPRGLCQAYPGNEGNIYAFGQEILVKNFLREKLTTLVEEAVKEERETHVCTISF